MLTDKQLTYISHSLHFADIICTDVNNNLIISETILQRIIINREWTAMRNVATTTTKLKEK